MPSTGRISIVASCRASSSGARGRRAAAASSSRMIVSVDGDPDPELASIARSERRGRARRSPSADRSPAVGARGAQRRDLEPGHGHQLVGHPGERRAADDPADRRPPRSRRRGDRLADARAPRGSARSTPPGSTGRARRRRRPRSRRARPGAGRAASMPSNRTAFTVVARRRAAPSTPGNAGRARRRRRRRTSMRVVTGSSVIGRIRSPHPNRAATARGHLRQRARPSASSWSSGTGASPRSRSPRSNHASGRPRTRRSSSVARNVSSRASPPALAVDHVAEPVGDGVQVGRDVQPVHRRCRRRCSRSTVTRSPGTRAHQPAEELPRADAHPRAPTIFMRGTA